MELRMQNPSLLSLQQKTVLSSLYEYMSAVAPLDASDIRLLEAAVTPLHYKRGQLLIREGEICDSVFFIEQGYCRSYHIHDGLEINTSFFFENDFIANIRSLNAGTPSTYFVKACENTIALKIDRHRLLAAYSGSHRVEAFGRSILERVVAKLEAHADLFKLMNAEERYLFLQQNDPHMLQRVSLSHLSSYIGISRETLSRIRHRLAAR